MCALFRFFGFRDHFCDFVLTVSIAAVGGQHIGRKIDEKLQTELHQKVMANLFCKGEEHLGQRANAANEQKSLIVVKNSDDLDDEKRYCGTNVIQGENRRFS